MEIKTLLEIIGLIVAITGQFLYLKFTQNKQSEDIEKIHEEIELIYSQEKQIIKLETQLVSHKEISNSSISKVESSLSDLEKRVARKFELLEKQITENHYQILGKFEELLKNRN